MTDREDAPTLSARKLKPARDQSIDPIVMSSAAVATPAKPAATASSATTKPFVKKETKRGREQLNVMISIDAHEKLEEIKQRTGMAKTEIVDQLILGYRFE